jgi:hypothetical protein
MPPLLALARSIRMTMKENRQVNSTALYTQPPSSRQELVTELGYW